MQGVYIGSRQIRVSSASHQKANQASVIFFFFKFKSVLILFIYLGN